MDKEREEVAKMLKEELKRASKNSDCIVNDEKGNYIASKRENETYDEFVDRVLDIIDRETERGKRKGDEKMKKSKLEIRNMIDALAMKEIQAATGGYHDWSELPDCPEAQPKNIGRRMTAAIWDVAADKVRFDLGISKRVTHGISRKAWGFMRRRDNWWGKR